ncbi:hypothetical protein L345_14561, partial [Ophiophagus hannah]
NHPGIVEQLVTCPFNARHQVPRDKISQHISSCDDKRCIEQDIDLADQSDSTFVWGTSCYAVNSLKGSKLEPEDDVVLEATDRWQRNAIFLLQEDGWSGAHNPSQQIHMDFLRPVDQASPSAPWPVAPSSAALWEPTPASALRGGATSEGGSGFLQMETSLRKGDGREDELRNVWQLGEQDSGKFMRQDVTLNIP